MAYANIVTLLGWRGPSARQVIELAGAEEQICRHEGLGYESSGGDVSDDVSVASSDRKRGLQDVTFNLGDYKLTAGWLDPGMESAEHPEIYIYISDLCYTSQSCGDDDFGFVEIPLKKIKGGFKIADEIASAYPKLPAARIVTIVISDSK